MTTGKIAPPIAPSICGDVTPALSGGGSQGGGGDGELPPGASWVVHNGDQVTYLGQRVYAYV